MPQTSMVRCDFEVMDVFETVYVPRGPAQFGRQLYWEQQRNEAISRTRTASRGDCFGPGLFGDSIGSHSVGEILSCPVLGRVRRLPIAWSCSFCPRTPLSTRRSEI